MDPDDPYGPLIDHPGPSGWFHDAFATGGTFGAVVVGLMLLILTAMLVSLLVRAGRYAAASTESAPALCIGRRMQVSRGSGDSSSSTSYYATFQFDDGSRRELRLSGQQYGLLAEGDRGQLTWRLDVFKALQRGPGVPSQSLPGIGGPVA